MNEEKQTKSSWSLGKKLKFSALYYADALKENLEGIANSIHKPSVAFPVAAGIAMFVPGIANAVQHNIPQPPTGAPYAYVLKIDPSMYETFGLQDKPWLTLTWIYSALGIPEQVLANTINTTVDEQKKFYPEGSDVLARINENYSYEIVVDSSGKKSIKVINEPDCCKGDVINYGDIFYFSKETGQKLFPADLDEILGVADVEQENGKTYITITQETINQIYERLHDIECSDDEQNERLDNVEKNAGLAKLFALAGLYKIKKLEETTKKSDQKRTKTEGPNVNFGIGYSSEGSAYAGVFSFGMTQDDYTIGLMLDMGITPSEQQIQTFEQKRNDGTLMHRTTEKTSSSGVSAKAMLYASLENLVGPFGLSIGLGPAVSRTKTAVDVVQQNYNELGNPEGLPSTLFLPEDKKTRWGGAARVGIPINMGKDFYVEPNYTRTALQYSRPVNGFGFKLNKKF